MSRFKRHGWSILTAGLILPVIVWAAPIPFPSFTAQTPIYASQMTQNFQNIEQRLKSLESKLTPTLSCIVQPSTAPDPNWLATCPGGYVLTGGGCATAATLSSIVRTGRPAPGGINQWTCAVTEVPDDGVYTYAVCCKISP